MADKNISDIIVSCCRHHGIKYCSINPEYSPYINDAKYLGKIIHELLALIGKLDRILDRHNIANGFGEKLRKDIELLHETEHDLFRLVSLIQKEKNV